MQAIVKYVHAISPCTRDIEGPFKINADDLSTVKKARAWLRNQGVSSLGLSKEARRLGPDEPGDGWVFFPMRKRGSVHWSVSIRLDVEEVQKQAEQCKCRNHPNELS